MLLLGKETDTQDITGRVLTEHPVESSEAMEQAVREAVMSFVGPYLQVPPMYSALKVNGKDFMSCRQEGS